MSLKTRPMIPTTFVNSNMRSDHMLRDSNIGHDHSDTEEKHYIPKPKKKTTRAIPKTKKAKKRQKRKAKKK